MSGDDNPNTNSMNEDSQVMRRPNAVNARVASDEHDTRVTVSGVPGRRSDLSTPVGPLDMDGETTAATSEREAVDGPQMVPPRPISGSDLGNMPSRHDDGSARGFLPGPGGEARTSSEVPASPTSPRPKRSPASFLGGVAKAVQGLPAAVEGLVMGQTGQAVSTRVTRSSEVEGYVSAQSGSPDGPQTTPPGPSSGPLLDERTLRRLNEMPEAAPHLTSRSRRRQG